MDSTYLEQAQVITQQLRDTWSKSTPTDKMYLLLKIVELQSAAIKNLSDRLDKLEEK